MQLSAQPVSVQHILPWRDLYRAEMNCQIIHDSLHSRKDWTQSYLLTVGGVTAGYGSIAVGGPWKAKPAIFEFYILPRYRDRVFDLFRALLSASGVAKIETQSNDPLLTVILHTFAETVSSESILFHDKITTTHLPKGALFRRAASDDDWRHFPNREQSTDEWVIEADDTVAAAGGILFHYNRPYGDIYMEVAKPFRRRGFGSYLVQELKRICYEGGSVPSARCNPRNIASRKTLQKAGFVPCASLLTGSVSL